MTNQLPEKSQAEHPSSVYLRVSLSVLRLGPTLTSPLPPAPLIECHLSCSARFVSIAPTGAGQFLRNAGKWSSCLFCTADGWKRPGL